MEKLRYFLRPNRVINAGKRSASRKYLLTLSEKTGVKVETLDPGEGEPRGGGMHIEVI